MGWNAALLLLILGVVFYLWLGQGPPAASPDQAPPPDLAGLLGYPPEVRLPLAEGGTLTVGPLAGGVREVALIQQNQAGREAVRHRVRIALSGSGLTAGRQDLPGHPGAVVLESRRSRGEPQYAAVALQPPGLTVLDYYALTAPPAPVRQGPALLVNKRLNVLYLYRDGALVRTYRVATGAQTTGPAPSWQDYATNFFTPEGQFTIDLKQVNPPYYGDSNHPPAPGAAPENPLGTRWLGFRVLGPDDPATIWGIHGTNDPASIGSWASDGCIRMRTPEVEELFDQVPEGTPLLIIPG